MVRVCKCDTAENEPPKWVRYMLEKLSPENGRLGPPTASPLAVVAPVTEAQDTMEPHKMKSKFTGITSAIDLHA